MALSRPKERIHPSALKVWRIHGIIFFVIELGVALGYYFLAREISALPKFLFYILLALSGFMGVLHIIVVPQIRMIYWGYELREEEVDIQFGIIVIKRSLIPMTRIQHVDTHHGPFMRLFGLATLSISTAGTKHQIPALKQETAESLRRRISQLALESEDDV